MFFHQHCKVMSLFLFCLLQKISDQADLDYDDPEGEKRRRGRVVLGFGLCHPRKRSKGRA